MKKLVLLLALLPLPAFAGDKIGNGGGLWSCRAGDRLIRAELVDLFEARVEYQLQMMNFGQQTLSQIFIDRINLLSRDLSKLYDELRPHLDFVQSNFALIDGKLRPIDDSLYTVSPTPGSCMEGAWIYDQFANFTPDGRIMIQKDLWENPNISPVDKAALLIHESVYRWLRLKSHDENSVRARRITGLLFSSLPSSSIQRIIAELVPELSDSPPSNGGVVDEAGMFIGLVENRDAHINYVLHQADARYGKDVFTGNFGSECRIAQGASGAAKDIFCILEIEELDLFFHDLTLLVHVPSDTCSFLRETPYFYHSHEPGVGPALVETEILADGSIRDIVNSKNGDPVCRFDYTSQQGPNCCVGEYIRKITTYSSDGNFSTTTTKESWDGSAGNCLAGPATSSQAKDQKGYPIPTTTYVENTGIAKTYTIDGGRDFSQSNANTNVWGANFYNPSDHGGGRPKALRAPEGLNLPAPSDTYTFQCLNQNEDLVARIRLMIREWNQEPREGGDPDISGPEPDFPDEDINDRLDWKDIGDRFPGQLL